MDNQALRSVRSDVLAQGAQLAGRMGGLGASAAILVGSGEGFGGKKGEGPLAHLSLEATPVISLLSTVAFAAPGVIEVRVIEALSK